MTVLVTGFDAFDGAPFNPSEAVIARVKDCVTAVLPTSYDGSVATLTALLMEYKPSRVIMLGLNAGAKMPMLERFALNVDDCEKPDNDGERRAGNMIDPDGPYAHMPPLDVNALKAKLADAGFEVGISNHAGAFVCNHVYYAALGMAPETESLFMHIPPVAEDDTDELDRLARLVETLASL